MSYLTLCWRMSPCRPALGHSLPEHHRWKNPQKYEEKPPHDHDRSWIIEVEHPRKKNNEKGLEFIVRCQAWNDFELDTSQIQETKTVTGKLEEAWLGQNQAAKCFEQKLSLRSLSQVEAMVVVMLLFRCWSRLYRLCLPMAWLWRGWARHHAWLCGSLSASGIPAPRNTFILSQCDPPVLPP